MKNFLALILIGIVANFSFGQAPINCGQFQSTGTVNPYGSGYTDPGCGGNVPGTVSGPGVWTGSGCAGFITSTVVGPAVTCLVVSYGAVNTNDYGTISTNTGGTLTLTGANMGINGNVVGPYNCGGQSYGNVLLTVCSDVPFTSVTLTNTGCTSGWVVNCASQATCQNGNCSVPCLITNMTASVSACAAGAYSTSGIVEFAGAPTTGQLIVEDCDGNQQVFNAPFTSPQAYNITGQDPDGGACDVTAFFTDDLGCNQQITYTAPVCLCNIDFFEANIGLCDQNTDTYGMSGYVDFTNAPPGGLLIVEVDNGTTVYDTVINPPFVSGQTYSISGIPSDGSASTITVYFSDNAGCTNTIAYNAPTSCACDADIGTFNTTITGSSPNDYVLCFGDQLNVNTNNDWSGPGEMFNPPGPAYNPGISWLMYSCPPTVAVTPNLVDNVPDDPCFIGLIADGNFADLNDLFYINAYPPGTFTDNTIYWVPLTMYDQVGGTYSFVNGSMPCYEMGTPYAVQYLPEITSTDVEDCIAGTAVVTVNGGLPEIDGSQFTASNLMPLTATFDNTSANDGGTITVSGLNGGEMWSFDITDDNGCPHTITGGPFPPLEDPGFSYTGGTWCTNDPNQNPTLTGVGGGTYVATPAGLSINGASGTITTSTSTPGVYDVTYTTPGVCFDDSTVTVTILEVPTVNPILDETVCVGDNFTAITFSGSMAGAAYDWTNSNPAIGAAAAGSGDIASFVGATNGGTEVGNFTVTPSFGGCTGLAETFALTVNDLDDATFDYTPGLTYCQTAANPTTNITGLNGGTFSYVAVSGGPTLDINPATGDIILANSDLGAYDITYNTTGAVGSLCPQTFTLQLVITPAPVADFTLDIYCANDADPLPTYFNNGSGGTFTSAPAGLVINANSGLVDLDASLPGTYNVTNDINVAGCPLATYLDDITVNEIPDANIVGSTTICPGDPLPNIDINITAGIPNWDVTYNLNGSAVTTNTAVSPLVINGAAIGTYDLVSVTDGNGCTNGIAGQVVIDEFVTPVMDVMTDQAICEGLNLDVNPFNSIPPGSTFAWTNTSGTDVGYGLNGAGDIGSFIGVNGTGASIPTNVQVIPTSADGCVGPPSNVLITVNPIPIIDFTGDPLVGCEPLEVTFTNNSAPMGQNCTWTFGDGNVIMGCGQVSNTYMAGDYDVSLTVTTAQGCSASDTYLNYVNVTQVPEALFSFAPQEITVEDPVVEFTNSSLFAETYNWEFGDNSVNSSVTDPIHLYPAEEPGQYLVTLWAYSPNLMCYDSISQLIQIDDVIIFYVPNIFTPDGDDYNETFQPVFTSGFDKFDYHLTIFNRWGEIIFESYDASQGWNGHYGDGGLVQDGVYIWQIDFKETMSDKQHTHRGHVTVLK
jgi:gliding motility-associated-like protein